MNNGILMRPAAVTRIQRAQRCENCGCVAFQPDGKQMECRREPPKTVLLPQPGGVAIASVFPGVQPDHWCKTGWCPKVEQAAGVVVAK